METKFVLKPDIFANSETEKTRRKRVNSLKTCSVTTRFSLFSF